MKFFETNAVFDTSVATYNDGDEIIMGAMNAAVFKPFRSTRITGVIGQKRRIEILISESSIESSGRVSSRLLI